MNPLQQRGRAYCISIGLDPDEKVSGYWVDQWGRRWIQMPRWAWYQ